MKGVSRWGMMGVFFICLLVNNASSGQSPSEVGKKILSQSEYQTSLPAERNGGAGWRSSTAKNASNNRYNHRSEPSKQSSREASSSEEVPAMRHNSPTGVSHLLELLIWVFAIIVFISIVGMSLKERSYLDTSKDVAPVRDEPKSKADPDQHFLDAADLATKEKYSEAVHVLLLRVIEILQKNNPFSKALTSRELVRLARLSKSSKEAIDVILFTAEIAYFGERKMSLQDYQKCAQQYQVFMGNQR